MRRQHNFHLGDENKIHRLKSIKLRIWISKLKTHLVVFLPPILQLNWFIFTDIKICIYIHKFERWISWSKIYPPAAWLNEGTFPRNSAEPLQIVNLSLYLDYHLLRVMKKTIHNYSRLGIICCWYKIAFHWTKVIWYQRIVIAYTGNIGYLIEY